MRKGKLSEAIHCASFCARIATNKLGAGVYFQRRVSKWLCPPSRMTKGKRYNWKGIDDWRGTIVQRTNVLNVFYLYMCEHSHTQCSLASAPSYPLSVLSACVLLKVFIPAATDHNEIEKSMTYSFHNQSIWSPSSLRHRTQCNAHTAENILRGFFLDTWCAVFTEWVDF